MIGKKQESQASELTSADAFAKGQKIYDRMERGECKDVTSELHATFGTKPKNG
ncbi:hypothetical protein [Streptomyces misionensis]|uniref:hypothetical protein n=1 Tax=Streptomyces misionensis TaxID=67331 RepID=UPI001644FBBE|nr:hypothetical protein [Streptomyces misionensis]